MERPKQYEDLVGLSAQVSFCRTRISKDKFPVITLYSGEEGIGKTSLMMLNAMALTCEHPTLKPCGECPSCKEARKTLLGKGESTSNIQLFKMSVEGGKLAAQESLQYLNTNFTTSAKRVVIYEECHRMSGEAQDVLLSPLEFLKPGVFVMFATTDTLSLNKALLSRTLEITLPKPSRSDIIYLLKKEAQQKGLLNVDGDFVYETIAEWSECKPRKALQILEAVEQDGKLSLDAVRQFTGTIDIMSVADIIVNLNDSIVAGIDAVMKLQISPTTTKQIVKFIVEAIKLKTLNASSRLTKDERKVLQTAIERVPVETLADFLYDITNAELTTERMLAAFLKNHPLRQKVLKHDPATLKQEVEVQARHESKVEVEQINAPTIEDLMKGGFKV